MGELGEVTSTGILTLSRLVGTLSRKGLVFRRRLDANARAVEINPTTEGRALVQRLMPFALHHDKVGLRGFHPGEVDELKRNLAKVHENLSVRARELSERAAEASRPGPVRPPGGGARRGEPG